MFQFDTKVLSLAHGAIHIATIGDFNLDLPGARRNFIAQAVDGFFDEFDHYSFEKQAVIKAVWSLV